MELIIVLRAGAQGAYSEAAHCRSHRCVRMQGIGCDQTTSRGVRRLGLKPAHKRLCLLSLASNGEQSVHALCGHIVDAQQLVRFLAPPTTASEHLTVKGQMAYRRSCCRLYLQTLHVAAMMTGENYVTGISDWMRAHRQALVASLQQVCRRVPRLITLLRASCAAASSDGCASAGRAATQRVSHHL